MLPCAVCKQICNLRAGYFLGSVLVSTLPEPPHFVQLLPALAASTQQAWVQALPSFAALAQQPAGLLSDFSAAKEMPAATNATRATNDLRDFMMIWLGPM
jgi:hypothetical protein